MLDDISTEGGDNTPEYVQPFLFLLSAKAGGVGLNLVGANRLVLYDQVSFAHSISCSVSLIMNISSINRWLL